MVPLMHTIYVTIIEVKLYVNFIGVRYPTLVPDVTSILFKYTYVVDDVICLGVKKSKLRE